MRPRDPRCHPRSYADPARPPRPPRSGRFPTRNFTTRTTHRRTAAPGPSFAPFSRLSMSQVRASALRQRAARVSPRPHCHLRRCVYRRRRQRPESAATRRAKPRQRELAAAADKRRRARRFGARVPAGQARRTDTAASRGLARARGGTRADGATASRGAGHGPAFALANGVASYRGAGCGGPAGASGFLVVAVREPDILHSAARWRMGVDVWQEGHCLIVLPKGGRRALRFSQCGGIPRGQGAPWSSDC